jgi:hypothetical protein
MTQRVTVNFIDPFEPTTTHTVEHNEAKVRDGALLITENEGTLLIPLWRIHSARIDNVNSDFQHAYIDSESIPQS